MILVWIVLLVFTIALCNANVYLCHYYDENTKSLEIYCDHYRTELPANYVREAPSIDPLQVVKLKIEGCDQSAIGDASEKYRNIRELDISYSGYRSLSWSGNAFENVIKLNASFNELTEMPATILEKFPIVKVLILSNNYLGKIADADFQYGGHELNDIILTQNMLNSIDDNAFANLNKLERIELSNNQLATFPAALSTSSVLEIVMLENPQFATIDCAVLNAIGSKHVYFTWNHIRTFDGGANCSPWKFVADFGAMDGIFPNYLGRTKLFCNNTRLENCFQNIRHFVAGHGAFENVNKVLTSLGPSAWKIDLSGNRIDPLNATAFQQRFPNLRELSVSDTGLTTLDFNTLNILNQKHLKQLDISGNEGVKIENASALQHLKQLTHLNAAGDQIQSANELLQYLPASIQYLNLSTNNLGSVNAFNTFGRLTALTHLNLSATNLSFVDANPFGSLRQLISLDVSNNNLGKVNFTTLKMMNRLREFHAANCRIRQIADVIPQLGSSVEILNLGGNLPTTFDSNAFDRLQNLKELNLSNINFIPQNKLRSIDVDRLSGSLERLDLSGTNLQRIDNLDRKHFPVLNELNLPQNQLECDYLDELHTQFNGAHLNGAECKRSNTVLVILFAILVILVVSIFIILASLWILPKVWK